MESHCGPGTFDYNDSVMPEGLCTVRIVEDVSLGEVFGKAPFAETSDVIGREDSGTIAERVSVQVV